jgi:PPM family protein phosphatase
MPKAIRNKRMNTLAEPIFRTDLKNALHLRTAALTKQGRKRQVNQDSVFHWSGQTELGQSIALALVCDGLGGHAAGDLASRLAVETISSDLVSMLQSAGSQAVNDPNGPTADEMGEWVLSAINRANSQIFNYANSHTEALNMGTTVTLAATFDHLMTVANVGDSRTYQWHDPELTQVTHDHSFVAELVENGLIREEEAAAHPKGNVILRALGTDAVVETDLFQLEAEPGDRLLLCSDGFWKAYPDRSELAPWFTKSLSPADLCKQLALESYHRSGTDDTSLVLLTIE